MSADLELEFLKEAFLTKRASVILKAVYAVQLSPDDYDPLSNSVRPVIDDYVVQLLANNEDDFAVTLMQVLGGMGRGRRRVVKDIVLAATRSRNLDAIRFVTSRGVWAALGSLTTSAFHGPEEYNMLHTPVRGEALLPLVLEGVPLPDVCTDVALQNFVCGLYRLVDDQVSESGPQTSESKPNPGPNPGPKPAPSDAKETATRIQYHTAMLLGHIVAADAAGVLSRVRDASRGRFFHKDMVRSLVVLTVLLGAEKCFVQLDVCDGSHEKNLDFCLALVCAALQFTPRCIPLDRLLVLNPTAVVYRALQCVLAHRSRDTTLSGARVAPCKKLLQRVPLEARAQHFNLLFRLAVSDSPDMYPVAELLYGQARVDPMPATFQDFVVMKEVLNPWDHGHPKPTAVDANCVTIVAAIKHAASCFGVALHVPPLKLVVEGINSMYGW